MHEEISQKIVSISFRTAKLTEETLRRVLLRYLQNQDKARHGKISVKSLMAKDQGATAVEFKGDKIRDFDKVVRKYNIDYSVFKDKAASPPKYMVFFKARDADIMAQAFKEFVHKNEKKKERSSIREKLKNLSASLQSVARTVERTKGLDRGRER